MLLYAYIFQFFKIVLVFEVLGQVLTTFFIFKSFLPIGYIICMYKESEKNE